MTLTHNCSTDWADAASEEPRHGGLTPFGEEIVREMNRMGMLVDLSHTAPATMHDVLDVAEAPVMWSHASARAIVDHVRNVPDDVLSRLSENGGVVMITFVPSFVGVEYSAWSERESARQAELEVRYGEEDPRVEAEMERWRAANPMRPALLSEVADHIEHIRDVAGIDHVGIGGDFDGITRVVEGLEDVSTYPALFAELARRGWSEADLRKLAGENILRAMRRAEEVARRLQRLRPPSTATLEGSHDSGV
jgi:membrane dipeptidase